MSNDTQKQFPQHDKSLLSLIRLYHHLKERNLSAKIELNFLHGEFQPDHTKITGSFEKLLTNPIKTG